MTDNIFINQLNFHSFGQFGLRVEMEVGGFGGDTCCTSTHAHVHSSPSSSQDPETHAANTQTCFYLASRSSFSRILWFLRQQQDGPRNSAMLRSSHADGWMDCLFSLLPLSDPTVSFGQEMTEREGRRERLLCVIFCRSRLHSWFIVATCFSQR